MNKNEEVLTLPDGSTIKGQRVDDGVKVYYHIADPNDYMRALALMPREQWDLVGKSIGEAEKILNDPSLANVDERVVSDLRLSLAQYKRNLEGNQTIESLPLLALRFGLALGEMRVRAISPAMKSGRRSKKGGADGGVKSGQNRAERSEGAYAMFRKYYRQEEAAHPELDPPKLCKRVSKFHGAKVHKQFECGTSPDTVARAMGFKK